MKGLTSAQLFGLMPLTRLCGALLGTAAEDLLSFRHRVAAKLSQRVSSRQISRRKFGHTADPTRGDLVLVFLFVLLAVSALAPPARNHSAFVSFLFVADLLVFGWLFFFADFFVFIGYLLVRGAI
jgi:hypothetical protein